MSCLSSSHSSESPMAVRVASMSCSVARAEAALIQLWFWEGGAE